MRSRNVGGSRELLRYFHVVELDVQRVERLAHAAFFEVGLHGVQHFEQVDLGAFTPAQFHAAGDEYHDENDELMHF